MQYTTHVTLLARLAEGVDSAAWAEFHERYGQIIRGFARRCGLQSADCEDVTQEVLLILSRSMPGFEYDPARGKFRSYLKTLVMRTVNRIWRQKQREQPLGDMEAVAGAADAGGDDVWDEEWRQHHVRHAMRRLEPEFNDQHRLAFSEYAMKDVPAAQVAGDLGMTLEQVYQVKSRMLRRLGELIAEQVEDEG
jgi:RNA polymerase sigma-70 factor (ECF subfamily)